MKHAENGLRLERPRGLLAGFGCLRPDAAGVPELAKLGEQWAPPGFAIAGHAHTRWEFYLQTGGSTVWQVDGRRVTVEENGLLGVPPGVAHALVRCRDERHSFVFAELELGPVLRRWPELAPGWSRPEVVLRADAGRLRAPFARLVHEAVARHAHRALGLRQALDALVLELSRLRAEPAEAGVLPVAGHAGVARARDLLESRPAEPWREAELARIAGLSPGHFRRRFTAEVGESPRDFLEGVRVARAATLLRETDLSVTAVAMETGFATSQHFARVFKARRRVTPREWRGGGR